MINFDIGNSVIVRGIDLFFDDATEQVLKDIAMELGGKSSYDSGEQKATYMFKNEVLVKVNKLSECHDIANDLGNYFSKKYRCDFEASERYLRTKKPNLYIT